VCRNVYCIIRKINEKKWKRALNVNANANEGQGAKSKFGSCSQWRNKLFKVYFISKEKGAMNVQR
jgi:hypothetical protein